MKLQKDVEELPVDSNMIVRSRSALGLKYVEITPGKSDEGFAPGSRIPIERATPEPVEFDDVFNTFDKKTREGQRAQLRGFGDGPGRPRPRAERDDRDPARAVLEPRAGDEEPGPRPRRGCAASSRRSSAPRGSSRRWPRPRRELFENLDTTFAALAGVARPFIQETISRGPAAMDAGFRGFPDQRRFLQNTRRLRS